MIQRRTIIVGAEINGLLLARELMYRGWKVIVCDQGSIPNPNGASHGMHSFIHPRSIAKDANDALRRWKSILSEIRFTGFLDTGVVVVNQTKTDSERILSFDETAMELGCGEVIESIPQLIPMSA